MQIIRLPIAMYGNEKMQERREAQVYARKDAKLHKDSSSTFKLPMENAARCSKDHRNAIYGLFKGTEVRLNGVHDRSAASRRETFCEMKRCSIVEPGFTFARARSSMIDRFSNEGIRRRPGRRSLDRSFANRLRYFYSSFIRQDSTLRQPFDRKTR